MTTPSDRHPVDDNMGGASMLDNLLSRGNDREQTLEILVSLKHYHQTQNFSHLERFGEEDPASVEMLQLLDDVLARTRSK